MKDINKDKRLLELRREYEKASDEEEKRSIILRGQKIRDGHLCRECRLEGVGETDASFPFCSEVCHETWAKVNYGEGRVITGTPPTLEEVIRRIRARIEAKKQLSLLDKSEYNA